MKLHLFSVAMLVAVLPMSVSMTPTDSMDPTNQWDDNTPGLSSLKELGEPMPAHYRPQHDAQVVKQGEELVKYGVTQGPDGATTNLQSQFFVCIDCHNVSREDPDLKKSDPEARLDFAIQHKRRFLPGTTFYGIVNRTSWYNGDYQRKYGALATTAHKNLENAIQLCATKCAMGRELEDWELEAVLAYFWSLELRLKDLNLSESDWKKLRLTPRLPHNNQRLISWIKGLYLNASPATFSKPPVIRTATGHYVPDIEKGKAIYVLSCMSCHKNGGITAFTLENSAVSYRLMSEHTDFGANFSVYNAVRNGIKASPGKGYMPNFPLERISDRQLKDLLAFINYQATHDQLTLEPFNDWIH